MANNTEEFWSINGVSLHQYGWSVTTVGGGRYDVPPRRGSNMAVAYRPGQLHRTKVPDQRTISLVMFMVGADPGNGPGSGFIPSTTGGATVADQRVQWNDNWDFLRRLIYENYLLDNRVTLTRRWRLTAPTFPATRTGDSIIAGDPGTPTSGVDRIVVASNYVEMTGQMQPTMTGRTRSDFQMDFTMADPYFYGVQQQLTMNPGDTKYLWNDGHDVASHAGLAIDLVGPLTKPVLNNLAVSPAIHLGYNGTIASGQTVSLNIGRFQATEHLNAVTNGTNRIANIVASGARQWMALLPGVNKLAFTAASGSGHVLIKWQPPYI